MKKTLFTFAAMLLMMSCKDEPKKQIHLEDYNSPQPETVQDTIPPDSISADTVSTVPDTSAVKKNMKKEKVKGSQ